MTKIRLKQDKLARAHELPKVYEVLENILSFCPIIGTTSTTHSVGKYLSVLLYLVTQNGYSLKDYFDAASRINRILPHALENGDYMLASLDVVSLFTNVPLKKTINISIKRIYNEKQITKLPSKHTLKKVVLDTCKKSSVFCQQ